MHGERGDIFSTRYFAKKQIMFSFKFYIGYFNLPFIWKATLIKQFSLSFRCPSEGFRNHVLNNSTDTPFVNENPPAFRFLLGKKMHSFTKCYWLGYLREDCTRSRLPLWRLFRHCGSFPSCTYFPSELPACSVLLFPASVTTAIDTCLRKRRECAPTTECEVVWLNPKMVCL